ncbi:MAG TPA: hypothetical protein VFH51_05900, partial [Myxococcota bacterium]|nr:hypothetical protein [Myxococcota bacterium]
MADRRYLVCRATLWACGDEKGDGFSVATLAADGNTWQPRLKLSALQGPYHCATGTQVHDTCLPRWTQGQAAALGAPVEAQPDPADPNATPAPRGGCHCAASRPAEAATW